MSCKPLAKWPLFGIRNWWFQIPSLEQLWHDFVVEHCLLQLSQTPQYAQSSSSHTREWQADKLLRTPWVCCEFAKKNLELVDSILCQSPQSCWSTQEEKGLLAFLPYGRPCLPLLPSLQYRICPWLPEHTTWGIRLLMFLFMSYYLIWSQVHTYMCHKEPGGIGRVMRACWGMRLRWAHILCSAFPTILVYDISCFAYLFPVTIYIHHLLLAIANGPSLGVAMPFYNRGALGAKMLHRFVGCRKVRYFFFGGRGVRRMGPSFMIYWTYMCKYLDSLLRIWNLHVAPTEDPSEFQTSSVDTERHVAKTLSAVLVYPVFLHVQKQFAHTVWGQPMLIHSVDVRLDMPSSFMLRLYLCECNTVPHSHTII